MGGEPSYITQERLLNSEYNAALQFSRVYNNAISKGMTPEQAILEVDNSMYVGMDQNGLRYEIKGYQFDRHLTEQNNNISREDFTKIYGTRDAVYNPNAYNPSATTYNAPSTSSGNGGITRGDSNQTTNTQNVQATFDKTFNTFLNTGASPEAALKMAREWNKDFSNLTPSYVANGGLYQNSNSPTGVSDIYGQPVSVGSPLQQGINSGDIIGKSIDYSKSANPVDVAAQLNPQQQAKQELFVNAGLIPKVETAGVSFTATTQLGQQLLDQATSNQPKSTEQLLNIAPAYTQVESIKAPQTESAFSQFKEKVENTFANPKTSTAGDILGLEVSKVPLPYETKGTQVINPATLQYETPKSALIPKTFNEPGNLFDLGIKVSDLLINEGINKPKEALANPLGIQTSKDLGYINPFDSRVGLTSSPITELINPLTGKPEVYKNVAANTMGVASENIRYINPYTDSTALTQNKMSTLINPLTGKKEEFSNIPISVTTYAGNLAKAVSFAPELALWTAAPQIVSAPYITKGSLQVLNPSSNPTERVMGGIEAGTALAFGYGNELKALMPIKGIPKPSEEALQLSAKMLNQGKIAEANLMNERLSSLKALDKSAAKFGLKNPSAYEEAISKSFDYQGVAEKTLSARRTSQLVKDLVDSGLVKSKPEAEKYLQSAGVFNIPYEIKRVGSIDLYSGALGDIKTTKTLEPLKYSPDLGIYKGESKAISLMETKGSLTQGFGLTYAEGSQGRMINRQGFIYRQSQGKPGEFFILENPRGRPSKVPSVATLKEDILTNTKLLGIKNMNGIKVRTYTTEFASVPIKSGRISQNEFDTLLGSRTPLNKDFSKAFKTSKDITTDILFPGNVEVSYSAKGKLSSAAEEVIISPEKYAKALEKKGKLLFSEVPKEQWMDFTKEKGLESGGLGSFFPVKKGSFSNYPEVEGIIYVRKDIPDLLKQKTIAHEIGHFQSKDIFADAGKVEKSLGYAERPSEKYAIDFSEDIMKQGGFKVSNEKVIGTGLETVQVKQGLLQKGKGYKLSNEDLLLLPTKDKSNIIMPSGKKSSEAYLKSLYQENLVKVPPITDIKASVPKPIISKLDKSAVDSLGKISITTPAALAISGFAGKGSYERYSPSSNIPYANINVIYPKKMSSTNANEDNFLGQGKIPSLLGSGNIAFEGRIPNLGEISSGRLNISSTESYTSGISPKQGTSLTNTPSSEFRLTNKSSESFSSTDSTSAKEVQKISQKMTQELKLAQPQAEIQIQRPRVAQPTFPNRRLNFPPFEPRLRWDIPEIPGTKRSNIFKKPIKKTPPNQFLVELRRKGKFVPIAKVSNPDKAIMIGKTAARGSLSASFRVKGNKGLLALKPQEEFRQGKKNPFVLVQKAPSRLNSLTERKAIVSSRRPKGGFSMF